MLTSIGTYRDLLDGADNNLVWSPHRLLTLDNTQNYFKWSKIETENDLTKKTLATQKDLLGEAHRQVGKPGHRLPSLVSLTDKSGVAE